VLDAYTDRWALITGASSGIGAEFARRLAARGMHLVLVARRGELMEELAGELDTRHGTKTELIVADLSVAEEVRRVISEVKSRDLAIELLVNNAGVGFVGEFEATDPVRMREMISLNVSALTELTYAFLGPMIERGHGGVINLSSVAAFQPVAYMPVYSATKAFVLHFSEALWAELRNRGVTVLALCPGTTRTEFFDVAGVSGWLKKRASHEPEQVVKAALKALEKRKQLIVPGWKNYVISLGSRIARRKEVVLQSMRLFRPQKNKGNDVEE
jgi:short-subunit dehydrogenase